MRRSRRSDAALRDFNMRLAKRGQTAPVRPLCQRAAAGLRGTVKVVPDDERRLIDDYLAKAGRPRG